MSTNSGLTEERVTDVESLVVDWMTEYDVPGASVAIVDGDETVYANGFGARNLAAGAPATPDTLYMLGSCSKTVTALAIMQLVERGEIALDDPISDYLPVFDDVSGRPVTVDQLLSHTSGVPDDMAVTIKLMGSELGAAPTVPLASREDFYRHLDGNTENRLTDSGEEFNYCNSGYTLLGFLVEHVTDRPFAEYATEEVLEPLGMERSTYSAGEFEAEADTMTPYFQDEEQPEPVAPAFDEFTQANGSLMSSVTEMATFLSETVTGSGRPAVPDVDGDALAEMQRPMTVMNETIDGSEVGYGYGWMSAPLVGDRIVGHGGGTAATTYAFWGLRDAGLGVVVGCNTHPGLTPQHVGRAVLATLQGHDPERTVPALSLRKKYDELTGEYVSYRDVMSVTVEKEGSTLQLRHETPEGEQLVPLFPESTAPDDYSFYTVSKSGFRRSVEFHVDDDGVDLVFQRLKYRRE